MNRTLKVGLRVGIPLLLLALCAGVAPYYTTIAVWELRKALPLLAAIVGLVVITAGFAAIGRIVLDSRRWALTLGVVGFLAAGVGGFIWLTHTHYSQDRTYLASVTVNTTPIPELAARAPYQVGEAQARPNLGDTAGDIADTTYLPGEDRYATLVNRRGWLSGYEVAFTQQVPLQGRGISDQKCTFDKGNAGDRVSGWFSHNLGREISKQKRGLRFAGSDAYAYCDGDTPMVVVPLKRQTGTWVVVERPAGVALYNGRTGELTFTTDTANLPGPSYPLSLAAAQRAATAGMGSYTDWLFGRVGWELPDDDINSGNDSEFTLNANGQPTYITPLTGRGSATAISVVSDIPARHSGLRLAPLTVHRLNPVWVSPQAIVDRIKADYQDIPNWQTIAVYEVIPTGPNSWIATLGTGQNILYRATGSGDLKGNKPTCLLRADGSEIRCGSRADVAGNGVGTDYGPGDSGATPPPADLSNLSNADLARLLEEAACRLEKTCQR